MQILQYWNETLNNHLQAIKDLTLDARLIAKQYENSIKNKTEIGFNIFKLTSDIYYRENFHSDIIKALLDPKEKHNEQDKFLLIFIDLLNKFNPEKYIDKNDFQNAVVVREKDNIDILISDFSSNKAILIENKINNAIDQKRQIPRYYSIVSRDFEIEAIVYLTLTSSKFIYDGDWSTDEISRISPLLYLIPSYGINCINLFDNWITPSIIDSSNAESLFLFRQYGNLLKFLNTNSMDTITLEKFYLALKENDNLKTSLSIKNMLNDLPEYLAIRIQEKYKNNCYPFKSIWRHQKRDTVFEGFEIGNLYLKMDIWCGENGYNVHFWNPKELEYDMKINLASLTQITDFSYEGENRNNIIKHFGFFEEDKLYEFIDGLLMELKDFKEGQIQNQVI